mmetsp:Transcript_11625/g.17615  ORF Transcript_11625/g.17615 Transcript_11625/m.17615 type:complete len:251 (-) Transcript_11625:75-827(-)|eukprot:CAMPEP_0201529106 /NCGR_PEP_ID=MMETSP0161_2-20130828/40639_1 /ASSEMBLY_ACC=CAM_ASM_000251 /TAXON_ID=180227 /ORGANISM="Neoparamoeba aestuarina, Strain SoJaBio B1-5/56/2" /LENGTH=250 /DNA_ID=CAMNT_0047930753 /DNA_START=44 /DNA_END=796 /DNA_ORIENTATION=+
MSAKKIEIDVPKESMHLVIGKGGDTVKKIRSETKTKITLPDKGSNSTKVIIEGDASNCNAAKKMIQDILAKAEKDKKKKDEKREKEHKKKKEGEEKQSQKTGKKYDKEQEKVDKLAAERAKYFEMSKKAYDAGDKEKAKEYSDKGKEITTKMEKAKQEGNDKLFKSRNSKGLNSPTIDLHGLQVEYAIAKLDEYLAHSKKKGLKEVEVITGAGNHSGPEGAKIKPEVEKHLKSKKYKFAAEKNGSYKVTL